MWGVNCIPNIYVYPVCRSALGRIVRLKWVLPSVNDGFSTLNAAYLISRLDLTFNTSKFDRKSIYQGRLTNVFMNSDDPIATPLAEVLPSDGYLIRL